MQINLSSLVPFKANYDYSNKNCHNNTVQLRSNCTDSISFSAGFLDCNQKTALNELNKYKPDKPEHIVFITDPNRDPDDLESFVIASELEKRGFVKVDAAITTLGNEETRENRAKFAKGAFKMLGINAAVGTGTDYIYGKDEKAQKRFEKDDQKF